MAKPTSSSRLRKPKKAGILRPIAKAKFRVGRAVYDLKSTAALIREEEAARPGVAPDPAAFEQLAADVEKLQDELRAWTVRAAGGPFETL